MKQEQRRTYPRQYNASRRPATTARQSGPGSRSMPSLLTGVDQPADSTKRPARQNHSVPTSRHQPASRFPAYLLYRAIAKAVPRLLSCTQRPRGRVTYCPPAGVGAGAATAAAAPCCCWAVAAAAVRPDRHAWPAQGRPVSCAGCVGCAMPAAAQLIIFLSMSACRAARAASARHFTFTWWKASVHLAWQ